MKAFYFKEEISVDDKKYNRNNIDKDIYMLSFKKYREHKKIKLQKEVLTKELVKA